MENMADVFYSPACFRVAFGGAADPVQNPPCRFLSGGVLSAESGDGCFGGRAVCCIVRLADGQRKQYFTVVGVY